MPARTNIYRGIILILVATPGIVLMNTCAKMSRLAHGPVFVTAFSPLLRGEKVDRYRWGAVGVGFAGIIYARLPDVIQGDRNDFKSIPGFLP